MVYVVRFSADIEWDIERGFSCWGDRAVRKTDLDIVQEVGGFWDDDELDSKQQRWVNQFSDRYEDRSLFLEDLARELAPAGLCRDDKYATWALFHHDGLSCFALTADTPEAAIAEFIAGLGVKFDPMLGDRTVGSIEYVQSFTHEASKLPFHLLKCESVEKEDLLD